MALTKTEIRQRQKDRYHSDPEYRERMLNSAKKYHKKKRETDPDYLKSRSEYNKANAAYFNKKAKQYNSERPFHYAFIRLRQRAKKANIPFNLTEEYLVSIWTGMCSIFNTELCLPYNSESQDPNKATIDKVIPELGYIMGNIHWVSNKANIIKSFGTINDHQLIVDYMKKYTPI